MSPSEVSSVLLAVAQVLASLAALVTAMKARRAADAAREAADAAHQKAAEACREQLIFALRDAAKQYKIPVSAAREPVPAETDVVATDRSPNPLSEVTTHA